jgi:hypothetical protein
MKINQFESDERRRDDSPGDRPWRKHAAPLNRPPSNPDYPKTPFNHDEWMKSSKPMDEGSDIPVPGDTIRTPKLEGKVSKVEEGYVYFTTSDGRNMRNTIQNCTVIEKLADQESEMFEDEEIDEVSTELLAKYKTAAGKDASAADKRGDYARGNKRFSGIVKATKKQFANDAKKKTDEGSMGGINRSAPSNDVSYEKVLDEVYGKWDEEQVNELSVGKLQAYKDAAKSPESFRNRPLRKLARTIRGVKGASDRIDTKTGNRRPTSGPERGNNESVDSVYEDLKADFSDILGKQHQEVQATKKGDVQKVPSKNNNFQIWYRKQTDNLSPVKWQVRNKTGEHIKQEGSSANEKEAYADAEAWISQSASAVDATSNVTLNFNAALSKQLGSEFYCGIWEGPTFVYSSEPQDGLRKTVIRTQAHQRTAGATLLPVMTISPKEANKAGLRGNSRYTLGPRDDLGDNVYAFPLVFHSPVEPGELKPIKEPAITVSSPQATKEAITPWGGYTADDPKAKALSKAPKSAMQGKDGIRFSDLVQDSIKTHGLKWAFNEYVIKHGLPPRQFQIFAGLTAKPKAKEPAKTDWTDPSKTTKSEKPQSWWQKLRGKLPFEE